MSIKGTEPGKLDSNDAKRIGYEALLMAISAALTVVATSMTGSDWQYAFVVLAVARAGLDIVDRLSKDTRVDVQGGWTMRPAVPHFREPRRWGYAAAGVAATGAVATGLSYLIG